MDLDSKLISIMQDVLPKALEGYHPRSAQIQAAEEILKAMENYQNIVLEAPTGSGKTMAYLIPAILKGSRVIISTKTKQLMSQIYLKDLPVMRKIFGDISVAVFKGRKNYFCPHRFFKFVYPNAAYYSDVISWYEEASGDISEIPYGLFDNQVIDRITADSNQCLYSKCTYYSVCPFYKAKDISNASNIVITNHHMLLSDIASRSAESYGTIFDPADHIIFDEAHSLPDIYMTYSGVELSLRRLSQLLQDNKGYISFDKLRTLKEMYDKIYQVFKDGKIYLDNIIGDVEQFLYLCDELISSVPDEDSINEFSRLISSYNFISSATDGVKLAEARAGDIILRYIPFETGSGFIKGVSALALSSVFISATLTTNESFDYFLKQTGLEEGRVTTVKLSSVFNMRNQGILLVPQKVVDNDAYMSKLLERMDGSALVICNSVKRMREVTEYLTKNLTNKTVYTQYGGDWSIFTSTAGSVLVGCATLREGLDLAGGDFKCVIIDKLPFEYPHDLFLDIKAAQIKDETGDAFMNFYLPRAVLYFKQAVGRLIRHESDKGMWVVLDDRMMNKSYGKYFRDVLDNVVITSSMEKALKFLDIDS